MERIEDTSACTIEKTMQEYEKTYLGLIPKNLRECFMLVAEICNDLN
jgi:hypothetical protein